MFWLDGSSKLPFLIVSTRFIGKPCVEHLAEDLASIENQAKIAKSWVEIGDFDRWCHAASELVDLTYYLIYADTTFLYYEELISADERLRRCSQLKSQLVDSVRFSTFELARTRLVANLKFASKCLCTCSNVKKLTKFASCERSWEQQQSRSFSEINPS